MGLDILLKLHFLKFILQFIVNNRHRPDIDIRESNGNEEKIGNKILKMHILVQFFYASKYFDTKT